MDLPKTIEFARQKLHAIVPDSEIRVKAELAYEINRLKKEKNAVILGHNYMEPAVYYLICDIVGDSLELSRRAAKLESERIVFCGVKFMAETAKLLNPDKTVLIPTERAGCSLAGSINRADVKRLKSMYPGAPVLCYINTYADVKAECDLCVTSGNAAALVRKIDDERIIFIPDKYLAANVASETGRKLIMAGEDSAQGQPTLIAWDGRCEVHEKFTVEDVALIRKQYPDALVLAHPECPREVVEAADFSGSTSAMEHFLSESPVKQLAFLTECAMADNLSVSHPEKDIIRMCSIRCQHMNTITLEQTLHCLQTDEYKIEIPADIAKEARRSVDRMLSMS